MIFDPTMSKKKKKKKKPFMLDDEGGGDTQTEETQQSETKEVEPEPTEDKDVEADEEDSRKKGKVNPRGWTLFWDYKAQFPEFGIPEYQARVWFAQRFVSNLCCLFGGQIALLLAITFTDITKLPGP